MSYGFREHLNALLDLKTAAITLEAGWSQREVNLYHALGLAGEAGEVAEVVKKSVRDGALNRDKLTKELGDVLWYWMALCHIFGLDPEVVAKENIAKLTARKTAGW